MDRSNRARTRADLIYQPQATRVTIYTSIIYLVFYPHRIFLSPFLHRAQTLTELTGCRGNDKVITVLGAPGEARGAVERVGHQEGLHGGGGV